MRPGHGETLVLQGCDDVTTAAWALAFEGQKELARAIQDEHKSDHDSGGLVGNVILSREQGNIVFECLGNAALYKVHPHLPDAKKLRWRERRRLNLVHNMRLEFIVDAIETLATYQPDENDVFMADHGDVVTMSKNAALVIRTSNWGDDSRATRGN